MKRAGTLNLYLISQNEIRDEDAYRSAIVAAETEEQARDIDPSDGTIIDWTTRGSAEAFIDFWAKKRSSVLATWIGVADESIDSSRTLLASHCPIIGGE
jgi:hypothetical protein